MGRIEPNFLRAKWHQWRDDRLFNFFAHFNQGLSEGLYQIRAARAHRDFLKGYIKYVRQERNECATGHNALALSNKKFSRSFMHSSLVRSY